MLHGIKIDNVEYDVYIKYNSIKRTFEMVEGKNAGQSLNYRRIRDLKGVGFSFTLEIEPNPNNPTAYDTLYAVLTNPLVDYHSIEMPYGQTTKTIEAYVSSGSDIFGGKVGGYNRWSGLSVTFVYMQPATS